MAITAKSISSNTTGLAIAEEASLKTLPGVDGADAVWYALEPNSYPDMGGTISTVAREPITNTRQKAKGTITDLEAKAGLNSDLTQHNLTRHLQGFFFADALEKPTTAPLNAAAVAIAAVNDANPDTYTAAAGLDVFKVNHLVLANNFGVSTNNGLKKVSVVAAGVLTVAEALVAEAAPPAAASIEAVGYEFGAGDLSLTLVGNTVVLTSVAIAAMSDLGLNVGEWIYVGGDAAGTQFALNTPFFARVKQIVGKTIVLDQTMKAIVADAGAAKTIRIFFGKVLRNAILAADVKRRTYHVERQLGNDGDGIQAEYIKGCIPNEMTINLSQASKATIDLSFVGLEMEYKTGADGVMAGTRVPAPVEDCYNTSLDLVAIRLAILDGTLNPSSLFGYATEMKLSIANGVTPNKALGVLGAFDANAGTFDASGSITAYFSTVNAAKAIRQNSDVGLTAIMAKKNYGIAFDLPLVSIGTGPNKVEKDKPIMAELTNNAAQCSAGYTALMTFFEYLPTVAMPV